MPFSRNPVFTGREDTLARLHGLLQQTDPVAITQPAAISGMGGIGKTQTAVEYAYRYGDEYTSVLWMRAEKETTLRESFVEVARLLKLPEADATDQSVTVNAIIAWLAATPAWLLILDNADDLAMASQFLPKSHQGRVLFTSRDSVTGIYAKAIPIDRFSIDNGALLLLRRAKRIDENASLEAANSNDREAARAISELVDGLPLALDQAGAYIEEAKVTPALYLELYQEQAPQLLADYGNPKDRDHDSVVVTFSLAFKKANENSPAVGDLLRFCVFLASDDIPEWIFTQAHKDILGESLSQVSADKVEWNRFVGLACRYSLLVRKPDTQMFSMHRLVQLVLRNSMDEAGRREWADRTVELIDNVFPDPEFQNWPLCDQLLAHALVCSTWINEFGIETSTSARLLNQTGCYLNERAQYSIAEPLHLEALSIRKSELGSSHPSIANSLNNLASLYEAQGRYMEAEPMYLEALDIAKHELGFSHPSTAVTLNNLAGLYSSQGRYSEAEPLHLEALKITKRELGSDHPSTANSLNNLAELYRSQDRYLEAEPLYLDALEIYRTMLGSSHPNIASSLNNLASLYEAQGRYLEAEPMYLEALEIDRKSLGSSHPSTAATLNNLAWLYRSQNRYAEAEPLYLEALEICEKILGTKHPNTIAARKNYNILLSQLQQSSQQRKSWIQRLFKK